jgi:hypothetical protein
LQPYELGLPRPNSACGVPKKKVKSIAPPRIHCERGTKARPEAVTMGLYWFWLGVCAVAFVLVCIFLFIDAGKHTKR